MIPKTGLHHPLMRWSEWGRSTVLKALFFKAKLYILALPLLLIFIGAAMNQAVIAANHDKFGTGRPSSSRIIRSAFWAWFAWTFRLPTTGC